MASARATYYMMGLTGQDLDCHTGITADQDKVGFEIVQRQGKC